ncbi:hypothetical protein SDC9_81462 [bioreactor metagenome]|uniref:Uncharacterized protein n=1 Tax=bioreactor metagenome TaxID=1076179 RepID=A0A644Z292_9ZZZZ
MCTAVVFENRNIDPFVGVDNGLVYFGLFQASTLWQRDTLVIGFLMCGNNFCPGSFSGSFDSAVSVTFTPVVARVVENSYLTGTCIETLFDDFRHQFWIGVSGQFGSFIPSDIRFYTNPISLADEVFHSPQFGNSFAKHSFGFPAQYGNHVVFCCSICSLKRLSEYAHRICIFNGCDSCAGKSNSFQEISSVHNVFNLLFVL